MDISIEREYELKRISIQRAKEEYLKLAYEKYPRLKEISDEIKKLGMQSLTLAISKEASSKDEVQKIQDKIKKLENEKEALIKKEKIVLEPEYSCKECKDTGYIIKDNIITNCSCLKQKMIDQYYNKYNSIRLKDETFDKFDINLYSDKANDQKYGSKLSPRENIKNILEKSKKFVSDDSIQNLLFIGNTGIGKTFLSGCIANDFLKENKTVIYQTTPVLLDSIFEYKFGSKNPKYKDLYDNLFTVDLLILDDLGTEAPSPAKFAELFNIINSRLLNSKVKTLISTNLDIDKLEQAYDSRIFSRLIGKYTKCKFFGDDIRQLRYK